ncbi:protein kinase C-binding protein NELL1-like isoform X3 [Pseudomyrmex gracilis]|uniref:protein kinase C-binding protein NELL1-like isoform X3 n=1 Tax=Pseudomyrmex gracilis TaxID=219809 RepID=UPI000994FE6E|nr:protein kinase C-binding protein NELL1-like isoform X3 [Pseudomyrmex gracilis]
MSAGTIVAFSHGNNRYLELQSSSRKNEFRFHYVSRRDGKVYVETFPFHLNDGDWHRVALSVSGSQVELLVDCHPLYRRLLKGPPDTNFTLPQLELWVGQRYIKHSPFRGDLQEVQLIAGPHGYLIQCPQLDSSCPTCGQFSILQNTVEQLMYNLNELTRRLAVAEGRISKVEECECQKSCRVNGTVHEDGATWLKDCQECSCVHGEIECRPMSCSPADCKNPTIPEGKCCPVCLKQCFMDGASRIYDHGEKMTPKRCIECTCHDGNFKCLRFTDSKCPPLPCPPSEQISVADECCKFCPGVDYCAKGHTCHANASCLNLQTTYACHCDIGFQGDGLNCHDVDECKQQGGSNGHHCNANTICVNVEGSYTCECLPGYDRIDKFNCADLDECATGYHHCDKHATCVNTAGSYYCICNEGYTGDGYTCKPVCTQTCQNGGECVAPERCSCRRGFIGNSCELDLDECASDLHRCHDSSSMCHNMPGWYYCRCKDGYRPALHYSTQGTQCVDIDECTDVTVENKHTCHPSAKCVNNEGGYKCVCPTDLEESEQECSLNCWFEDREVNNGESVAPANNSCSICTCQDGVISCKDPVCDCSIPGSHMNKCCPQCDPKASCRHQELHHLVFRSKERWIYQCQTCECMRGEIDCWPLECPPVTCSDPVTENGDCCPRCHDDPCGREVPTNGISLTVPSHPRPCSYAGVIHSSGSSWQDPHDKCTTCECKVPYCAQLVSNSACCVHRTGSFAAATITAALTIWVTRSSDVLQTLFVSLSYIIYQTLRSSRWSTIHRKQLYQRSPAHSAPHAPSHPPSSPPSQAPPSPSRRPRTTHHQPVSATTTLAISGGNVQEAWMCRRANGSLEARRRRRRSQSSPRRRRRRRRGRECPDRRCCDVTIRQALPVATAMPSPPLPSLHRCHRLLLRWSWLQQPRITNITIDRPGVSLRTSVS